MQGGLIAEVSPQGPGVFRVRIARGKQFVRYPSYAIVGDCAPEANASCVLRGTRIHARSGDWSLRVAGGSGQRRLRLELLAPGGKSAFSTAHRGTTLAFDKKEGLSVRFSLARGMQYYGLGEFGERIGRVPGKYRCWNTDDPAHQPLKQPYCCIPFMMSPGSCGSTAHAVFVDNPGSVTFDLGMTEPGVGRITAATGELDLWFLGATSPAELMATWTHLTGRTERPPLWSLGYHQSRYSYMSGKEVRQIAREARKRDIPISVIHLDIHYMDGYRVFTWNPKNFAHPDRLTSALEKEGVRAVTILDPGVKVDRNYRVYREGLKKRFFVTRPDGTPVVNKVWPGDSHHPDFTNPAAREWWGQLIKEALLDKGISGIWCDMNEPAVWDVVGPGIHLLHDFALDGRHDDEGAGRSHGEIHNVYGLCMARAVYEALQKARPDERPFVLTRSGWVGTQRYGALWTGDNRSTYGSIPVDLTTVLSLSASGVSFSGCDIGGFLNDSHGELFVRWMEWSVFLPFCRAHTAIGTLRQEPWSFGPETEDAARRLLRLRMELMPYLYTAFVESSETGTPIVRPLWFVYPTDGNCREIGDQFLLGRDILVTPIVQPGIENRAVYLPGGGWYRASGGERLAGGRWVADWFPLGWVPAYVRAGAVVPRAEGWDGRKSKRPRKLVLDVYPARGQLTGSIVEDDGITTAYHAGAESRRVIQGRLGATTLSLRVDEKAASSRFQGSPLARLYWNADDLEAFSLRLNGAPLKGRWNRDTPLVLPAGIRAFTLEARVRKIRSGSRKLRRKFNSLSE